MMNGWLRGQEEIVNSEVVMNNDNLEFTHTLAN